MQLTFFTLANGVQETVASVQADVLPHEGDYVSLPGEDRPPYHVKSVVIDYTGEVSAAVYIRSEVG